MSDSVGLNTPFVRQSDSRIVSLFSWASKADSRQLIPTVMNRYDTELRSRTNKPYNEITSTQSANDVIFSNRKTYSRILSITPCTTIKQSESLEKFHFLASGDELVKLNEIPTSCSTLGLRFRFSGTLQEPLFIPLHHHQLWLLLILRWVYSSIQFYWL